MTATRRTGLGAVLLCGAMLVGCAAPAALPSAGDAARATGDRLVGEWQHRLAAYVDGPGFGDPGVLTQLPLLRGSAVLRPGQIVFSAIDIDATTPERDGYDVCGLLLGRADVAGEAHYLWLVGIVERSNYRPLMVADIRLVAMTPRQGTLVWQTGSADPQALERYRSRLATTAVPRFPAPEDRFTMSPCAGGVCAEELGSSARWALSF